MVVGDFTLIRDLDVLKDMFTMKLRIIRLWTLEDYYNKDEIFSIQLILMDEQGNKIQGYVTNAYIYKFRKVLKEGEAYFIKNPNLAKMDEGKFQLTDQMQKLTFNRETTVTPCLDFFGSVVGFALINYHPIIAGTVPQNISLDVIGLVVAIVEIDARNEDRKRHKMRLQIQDLKGSQLDVNLWGDYCYTLSDYIQKNPNILRIVIILQFAKINVWQDRRYVNTYYDVSKFIINSDIDEIKVFKKSTFSYMKSNQSSKKDDFVFNHELKTIADIFEPTEIKKYVIVATIKGILQHTHWYYPRCTYCNTKAVPKNPSDEPSVTGSLKHATYECRNPKCTKTETLTVPRFMIPVRVQDHTGSMTLTMFEQDAKKLLKISAKDLVVKTAKLGFSTNVYPSDINVLKDMKLAFIVSVSKYNVQRNTN
ncbi:unnamed protein product [Lactuca virosa]|uniref:Replication factor A C-terminal domain-containing protein n=1 Tax=Lactuca virosa TaxID=75947 RepID=A0AAU9PNK0_9ASTR|nr:unnamed protein product [Lactuca virosa]